jgi:hypothetical protein
MGSICTQMYAANELLMHCARGQLDLGCSRISAEAKVQQGLLMSKLERLQVEWATERMTEAGRQRYTSHLHFAGDTLQETHISGAIEECLCSQNMLNMHCTVLYCTVLRLYCARAQLEAMQTRLDSAQVMCTICC